MKTQIKAAHTPTPWFQSMSQPRVILDRSQSFNGGIVALIGEDKDQALAQANAAFIVRAVNAHDELLRATRACLDLIDGDKRWLAAIIAKAEGK